MLKIKARSLILAYFCGGSMKIEEQEYIQKNPESSREKKGLYILGKV